MRRSAAPSEHRRAPKLRSDCRTATDSQEEELVGLHVLCKPNSVLGAVRSSVAPRRRRSCISPCPGPLHTHSLPNGARKENRKQIETQSSTNGKRKRNSREQTVSNQPPAQSNRDPNWVQTALAPRGLHASCFLSFFYKAAWMGLDLMFGFGLISTK